MKPIRTLTVVTAEEREADSRPLEFALIRRLMRYARPYAGRRNRLLALVVLRSIQLPALAWALGAVMGGPVSRLDVRGVLLGAGGYALLAAVTQLTLRYRSRTALELGEDVLYDLRNEMFAHLQSMTLSFFQKTKIGRVISRFTSDAEAVRVGVQDVLFISMVGVGQMVFASLLLIYYDWLLFLVVALITPLLWYLNVRFRHRLSRAHRAVQESFSRVTATLAESVSGIRVIQGFARQDVNAGLFHDLVADHSRYNVDAARAAGIFLPLLDVNAQVFVAVVLVFGGWRVLQGRADVEGLYQFLLLTGFFFGPVQVLGAQYTQALAAMAGAERVFRFLDTPPEWTDPPSAVRLPAIRGRIEFRGVSFGYEPGRPVLHDLHFAIEPGQTAALIGRTGSGKSSIINLITKFYLPTRGEILIDGQDLLGVDSHSLQSQMGIVLQQNFLFTGTVLDNIRLGRPGATREEIIRAVQKLNCLDLIDVLPEGFLTMVGERGAGISLGQRQIVCFARAMLADPRILILDEATSSVDAMTEARIQEALALLLKGRTSVVVAHRLSTIRHADAVLVIEDGRLVEQGTHRELLLRRGAYARLYREFVHTARGERRQSRRLPPSSPTRIR
jgi:ATP-binding cassette subfamily B protein